MTNDPGAVHGRDQHEQPVTVIAMPAIPPAIVAVPTGPRSAALLQEHVQKGPIPACMSAIKKLRELIAFLARRSSIAASGDVLIAMRAITVIDQVVTAGMRRHDGMRQVVRKNIEAAGRAAGAWNTRHNEVFRGHQISDGMPPCRIFNGGYHG
jgi:hypothetical protein